MVGDPIHPKKAEVQQYFELEDGNPTPATNISKLEHRVRDRARAVNMVVSLAHQSRLNRGKFAKAGYVSVCNGDQVKIYDERTATITVSEAEVLKGWRCPCTKL